MEEARLTQREGRGAEGRRRFEVSAKDVSYTIIAQSPQMAMKDFMRRVMIEQIGIEDLGQLGMVHEVGKPKEDTIPFRIAPAMFNLGKLTANEYISTLKANISPEISMADAMKIAKADKWLTEIVK